MQKKQPAAYDPQAESFAGFATGSFSWKAVERPLFDLQLRDYFNLDTKVLYAGCGSGRISAYLIEKGISAKNIVGVDISKKLLELAHRHVPGVKFVREDLRDLRLDSTFNLITAHMVLESLDGLGLKDTFKNFFNLLEKNGALFFIRRKR